MVVSVTFMLVKRMLVIYCSCYTRYSSCLLISASSTSSKDSSSRGDLPLENTFKKRSRDSMYLATPVVNPSRMNADSFTYMKERERFINPSPSKSSVTSQGFDSSRSSNDVYQNDNYHDYTDNYDNDVRQRRQRTHSTGTRLYKKPPLPIVKVRAKEFHSSADMLAEIANNQHHQQQQYTCTDFQSTGIYSMSAVSGRRHYDYGSNPSIPQSFSSPGIAAHLLDASPNTLRRLQELSLSPSAQHKNNFTHQSYSQVSLESSSEQSECWSDVLSEETLV